MLTLNVHHKGTTTKAKFISSRGQEQTGDCFNTVEALKIIYIARHINTDLEFPHTPKLRKQFPELFSGGVGKLHGREAKLHIDSDVPPIHQRDRRIPFHIRKDVEAEIQRLIKLDIIEKA